MSSDFRQFIDIKRELEYKISELKNHNNINQYEKTIEELKQRNIDLGRLLSEKENEIDAARNECDLLRTENEKYKNNKGQLPIQKSTFEKQSENATEAEAETETKSALKSFLQFLSK